MSQVPSSTAAADANEHFDVLLVGAGISGIGAAVHLQKRCPQKRFAILEARDNIGGTWDLFRYPGIRSDSDMYTLGYRFKPWTKAKAIADGPSILAYLNETIAEYGLGPHLRTGTRVLSADWSDSEARWTLRVETGSQQRVLTAGFLWICSGYYRYDQGYTPDFPGLADFKGRVVHPQHWGPDIDYTDQRVVVIGSGATAVTLVPAMARDAAHVTMLQRSPTYVVSAPAEDALANWMNRRLPKRLAYTLTRWKKVLLSLAIYKGSRRFPDFFKRLFILGVKKAAGPTLDVTRHFTPSYKPWDQRLCLVPDNDLFRALRSGRASVVTDHIERFTASGILLKSGQQLEADLVVTATGLELQVGGGIAMAVNGKPVEMNQHTSYKGMMLSDVPNMAFVTGYTNASWTLKADLVSEYVCRLLNHMDAQAFRQCTPRLKDPKVQAQPWVDFNSSYVLRALDRFPRQGDRHPWRLAQNYVYDLFALRYGRLDDGAMEFGNHR